ncbi:hypothetical protein AMATHDRAFT_142628 [Amanita thiersii Skay4041]|uniref:MARVEL domain-containing protein n=1 Tax=Amanita thiersii Skay4041 TaxID=703135 RepID=A0A2A9NLG4_9AGAR|nr:hypothetical protein AMATHDRAFT_142628 [Amanita thiersii Skay4041]
MPVAIYPSPIKSATPPPPRSSLPLPLPLFFLTCLSLAGSWVLLVLSLLDLGYLSMWMCPLMSLFTILYHLGVLILSRAKRSASEPTYFSTVIVLAYLFGVVWFAAFILTNVIIAVKSDYIFSLEDVKSMGLPATAGTQGAQVFFALFEAIILEAFAIKAHLMLRKTGDPEDWRPKVQCNHYLYLYLYLILRL